MRELIKDVNEVLKGVVASPPIYRVSKNYDGVRLEQIFKPTMNTSHFLADVIAGSISEELDIEARCNKIRASSADDIASSMRYAVRSTIVNFLRDYQDTKNNKLTTLYRWYNEFLDTARLKNNEQLDNDMYNLFKCIKMSKDKYIVGDKFPNGIVSILGVLKQRYEAKGMKL